MLGWNAQDVAWRIQPTDTEVAGLGPKFQELWDRHFKDFSDRPLALMSGING
jgi:hypothetical protein